MQQQLCEISTEITVQSESQIKCHDALSKSTFQSNPVILFTET